jgi:hypothetical protein
MLANPIIGPVNPPPGVDKYSPTGDLAGLAAFFNNIIKFMIVVAGLYALIMFVIAGYGFISATDDPKKVASAWAKIWQSMVGLAVAAGSFVLAAIAGQLLFKDYNALLQLQIFGPI